MNGLSGSVIYQVQSRWTEEPSQVCDHCRRKVNFTITMEKRNQPDEHICKTCYYILFAHEERLQNEGINT